MGILWIDLDCQTGGDFIYLEDLSTHSKMLIGGGRVCDVYVSVPCD
jgi:hypothetical protein